MTRLVLASADDWIGLYVDGSLVNEGHQIELVWGMKFVAGLSGDITIEKREVNLDWIETFGSLPSDIADVVWEGTPFTPPEYEEET